MQMLNPHCVLSNRNNRATHKLQTDYTRYSTVFNSDAVQSAQFCVRACKFKLSPLLIRASSLGSNFHQHNDVAECKFDCFGCKVTLCNFWGYYTKYYTFNKNAYKSLIYKGFLRAWLSVNQGFCGQNLGQRAFLFLSVMALFVTRSMSKSKR